MTNLTVRWRSTQTDDVSCETLRGNLGRWKIWGERWGRYISCTPYLALVSWIFAPGIKHSKYIHENLDNYLRIWQSVRHRLLCLYYYWVTHWCWGYGRWLSWWRYWWRVWLGSRATRPGRSADSHLATANVMKHSHLHLQQNTHVSLRKVQQPVAMLRSTFGRRAKQYVLWFELGWVHTGDPGQLDPGHLVRTEKTQGLKEPKWAILIKCVHMYRYYLQVPRGGSRRGSLGGHTHNGRRGGGAQWFWVYLLSQFFERSRGARAP